MKHLLFAFCLMGAAALSAQRAPLLSERHFSPYGRQVDMSDEGTHYFKLGIDDWLIGTAFLQPGETGHFKSVALFFPKKQKKRPDYQYRLRLFALDASGHPAEEILADTLFFPERKGWSELDLSALRIPIPQYGYLCAVQIGFSPDARPEDVGNRDISRPAQCLSFGKGIAVETRPYWYAEPNGWFRPYHHVRGEYAEVSTRFRTTLLITE